MATVPSSRTIGSITGLYYHSDSQQELPYTVTFYLMTSYTQSAADNTSTVHMYIRAALTSGTALPIRISSWSITGNGGTRSGSESAYSGTFPRNTAQSSKVITHGGGGGSTFSSGATVTVKYYKSVKNVNSDATATLTLKNTSYSLPTINVYSSLAFSTTTPVMGSALTMAITKAAVASDGVKITATYDGNTVDVYEGNDSSYTWAVPDLVSTTQTSPQKAIAISIQSIKGSTYYNAKTYTIYAQVPASYVPTVQISNVNDQYNWGTFVKGYSLLNIFADASVSDTGVTIAGYSVAVRETSASGNLIYSNAIATDDVTEQFTMPVPITSVNTYIEVTVTDSRGRTGTDSVTVTAVDYVEPQISITAARSDSNGTKNPVGNYINVNVNWSITQIGSHNVTTENLITYLSTDGGTFTQVNSTSVSGYSGTVQFVTALSSAVGGELQATLKDSISAQVTSNIKKVPRSSIPLSMYDDKTDLGVTMGGIAAAGGFQCLMPAYFQIGGVMEGALADYIIEVGTSGNWNYVKYNSGKAECWCEVSNSVAITTATVNGIYRNNSAINSMSFPSGLFTAAPEVFCTVRNTAGTIIWTTPPSGAVTATNFPGNHNWHIGSGTYTCINGYYAVGKWK